MTDFTEVDYFNELDLVEDPHPYFEYLRVQGPVTYLPKHNVYAVTGYEEGVAVLKDHKNFSSINAATGPLPPLPFTPEGEDISEQLNEYRSTMPYGSMLVAQDPPEHSRSRSLVSGLLTPKRMKENEEFIRKFTDRLIDNFADKGRVEVVAEFAKPLATLTIADLLGVPEEDHKEFITLFGPLPGRIGGDDDMENNPMMKVGMHFYRYIEDRRREPRDDVMTKLALEKYPDGELPDLVEIVSHAAVLFGAGQDTTVRLIAASLREIAERPDIQIRLREDRALIPSFVEEVLRLHGPVKAHFRLAKRNVKVGEMEVSAGATIMLVTAAMSRDPRQFDDANTFRIERKNMSTQLAFGRGVHTCVGAALARTEARLAIERIFDRVGNIRIDEAQHGAVTSRRYLYEPNYTQRALCELHLLFAEK